jgi:hypothetical protein
MRLPRAQRRPFEPAIEPAHDAKVRAARRPLVEHELEPDDAAKARVARGRLVDHEPKNAAKGERGNAMNGAIQC